MQQPPSPWRDFENLVSRILAANGIPTTINSRRGDDGYDLQAVIDNEQWAIEVKFYRTVRAQPTLIETAATRLVKNGLKARASKAMLVMSCVLTPELRQAFEKKFSVVFVDQVDLRNWVAAYPQLAEELDALVEADPSDPYVNASANLDPRRSERPLEDIANRQQDTEGSRLCNELRSIKRGKGAWQQYERVCEKILKYLFPNDLHGWHKQKRTDDGLNRYDFICRVRPTTEFWKFAIDHLNSRYALFEFKNYSGKIKQGQILTTEKYLLERGLRRMAIIFTRVGADDHAVQMTRGAMREHGKLMLIIDDDTVCGMLHMKERGGDPTDCLFEIADNFLMSLPR